MKMNIKRWKLLLPILLGILITSFTLCYSFAEAPSSVSKLLFLGNTNIIPIVYQDNNIPAGVAVDIVHALEKHVSQPIEIKVMDWSEAQALVARGEADALIQINPTEERKNTYDFSEPLLESKFSIFTTENRIGISGISSLLGLRVGVESGGLPYQFLAQNPHIKLTIIPSFLEGFKLLTEYSIDAVVVDYRVGSYILAENKIHNIKVTGEPITYSYSAFAVRKGNTTLLNEINNALQIIKADGTYQKIIDNWEPKEVVFQTREQITRTIYYTTVIIFLILFVFAMIWMVTLKRELIKRKVTEEKLTLSEEKFSDIFHLCPDAIVIARQDGVFREVNEGFTQIHSFTKEEVIEKSALKLGIWAEPQEWEHMVKVLKHRGEVSNQEVRFRSKDGSNLYGLLSARLIDVNKEENILFYTRDITERKLAEKLQTAVYRISEMALSASNLEELCRYTHEIISELFSAEHFYIVLHDEQGQVLYCPYCFGEYYISATNCPLKSSLMGYVIKTGKPLLADAMMLTELASRGEIVIQSPAPLGWLGVPLTLADGNILGIMVVKTYNEKVRYTDKQQDIFTFVSKQVALAIERKQVADKIKFSSVHDALTDIYNRTYFEEKLAQIKEECDTLVALFICDINGMKLVNDTLGHAAGDQLLKDTTKVIQSAVCEDAVVARIGGDEFAIILTDTNEQTAKAVCERIRMKIAEHNRETIGVTLSLSIGYAVQSAKTVSVEKLFQQADDNMYREKLHQSQSARSNMIQALMKMMEVRDFITEGHADRLQYWSIKLALEAGMLEKTISDIRLFGKFHDIGKVGIPNYILLKPGSLTPEEKKEIQRHAEIGFRIAQASPDFSPIADWILKHHEWWNGQGYPLKLKREEIPLACRILAIVDAYDAMTNDRPYRKAMSKEAAKDELRRCAGTQFDPNLVEKFISMI